MKTAASLAFLAAAACAGPMRVVPRASLEEAGFHSGDDVLRVQSDGGLDEKTSRKVDEDLIAKVRSFRSRPQFPGKFAVVRVAPAYHQGCRAESLTEKELRPFAAALQKNDAVSTLDPLPGMLLPPKVDLTALRYAAARIGARYLIVYASDTRHDQGWTWAANLNWLIVPYLVVPSTEVYAASACESVVVDVNTNAIYFTAHGFSDSRTIYWNLSAKESSIEREEQTLVEAAVDSMAQEISRKLDLLKRE
jgi:hypothetical protein